MPIARTFRFIALAAAPLLAMSACDNGRTGEIKVSVIGSKPKLADPAAGTLSGPDSVLLQNVAQGLVSFDSDGEIVGGLAERWNVSDDGLSYIFRLQTAKWPDGSKITAEQVARALRRQLQSRSRNALKDSFGAIDEVVAMTERVIEIRLVAPRPNLLPLLAQPEMAILRNGAGTGPFKLTEGKGKDSALKLVRDQEIDDDEQVIREEVLLDGLAPEKAIAAFDGGETDLVLGGTFADLPLARRVAKARTVLRFDATSGLFGLVPLATSGPLSDPEVRKLLSQAIDREALIAALSVPGLQGRATLLEPGLDGIGEVPTPAWAGVKLADRQAPLIAAANREFGKLDKPAVRLFIPVGPGGDILFQRLQRDWGAIGLEVTRATAFRNADFALIDEVAPSTSPAWFVRHFRCQVVKICTPDADELLDAARTTLVPAQRAALIAQAAALMDEKALFIPIAAPVRWSLVGPRIGNFAGNRISNFAGNRYARHSLVGLENAPSAKE